MSDFDTYLASLSPEKLERVKNHSKSLQHGLQAIAPLLCRGPKNCPFYAHCPIPVRQGERVLVGPDTDYPIGRSCVMERLYLQDKQQDYHTHLQVAVDNPVETAIANDLALIDLYKNRVLMILGAGDKRGHGQDFMFHDVTAVSDSGAPIATTTQLHPAVEMLTRLENRRTALLDRLLETRKAKVDLRKGEIGSSKVLEELNAVRTLLEQQAAFPQLAFEDEPIKIK